MSQSPAPRAHVEEEFSLPRFLLTIAVSLAALAGLLWLAAPASVWHAQLGSGWGALAAAFLVMTMLNCFVEHAFHRYVLHKPVVPLLSRLYKQHTLHHNLTRIGRRRTPGGREVPVVENIYPITTKEQGEASFFPWFTLAGFAAFVTPLLMVLQWLAPAFPWFFAGYGAIAASLTLYEVFHAIEHWSFEGKWLPLIERPRTGWFWRKVYSFHLRHHAVIDCNEAISGFFTLPVADWVLGTYIMPKSLYLDGSEWKPEEFTSPRPCALIRWCDEKSDALIRRRRERAAAPPAAYTRAERVAHALTHGAGLAASVTALGLLVALAALRGGGRELGGAIVFGVALVALHAAFMNFRRVRAAHWRELFHKYNHAAAFLLIAGTATPFLLSSVRGTWGWSLFGVVWGLCLVGAACRLAGAHWARLVSRGAYAGLAMLGLVALKPVLARVPAEALWLLAAGAACYGAGAVFHLWQRVRFHQAVRSIFTLGGGACHLFAVLIFVLPARG
jgi:hemolysin III